MLPHRRGKTWWPIFIQMNKWGDQNGLSLSALSRTDQKPPDLTIEFQTFRSKNVIRKQPSSIRKHLDFARSLHMFYYSEPYFHGSE